MTTMMITQVLLTDCYGSCCYFCSFANSDSILGAYVEHVFSLRLQVFYHQLICVAASSQRCQYRHTDKFRSFFEVSVLKIC